VKMATSRTAAIGILASGMNALFCDQYERDRQRGHR